MYATHEDAIEYNASESAFPKYLPTLHIPAGSYISYTSTEPWCYFWDIVEEDYTGIEDVIIHVDEEVPASCIVGYYDLQGRPLKEPQRGINIIRYSNGTSKKVLVK